MNASRLDSFLVSSSDSIDSGQTEKFFKAPLNSGTILTLIVRTFGLEGKLFKDLKKYVLGISSFIALQKLKKTSPPSQGLKTFMENIFLLI